ncbi:MAG: penicillin-binding protein activator LpoB [Leptospiraceae bacterium]|nr:penicillin-binding protein activator LpoB [Leptospiraceae bacterium]MCP5512409.1 penicillin-binding protein activator LpoB [Leptospiraceae bacterium]
MKYLSMLILLSMLATCSSGAKRLDSDSDMVSDTGGLTRTEMEEAARIITQKIAVYFKKNPSSEGIFVALTPTKNETSEQLPTDVFDNALVQEMIKNKIYTLRTEKRQDQLKEIKISQQMGSDFDLGDLKSPNYFIRSRIDENMFRSDGKKIVEQILNVEFIQISSLAVAVSEKQTFRKKARDNSGVGW